MILILCGKKMIFKWYDFDIFPQNQKIWFDFDFAFSKIKKIDLILISKSQNHLILILIWFCILKIGWFWFDLITQNIKIIPTLSITEQLRFLFIAWLAEVHSFFFLSFSVCLSLFCLLKGWSPDWTMIKRESLLSDN